MLKIVVENKTDIGGNNSGLNAEALFQDHQYCLYYLHHGLILEVLCRTKGYFDPSSILIRCPLASSTVAGPSDVF